MDENSAGNQELGDVGGVLAVEELQSSDIGGENSYTASATTTTAAAADGTPGGEYVEGEGYYDVNADQQAYYEHGNEGGDYNYPDGEEGFDAEGNSVGMYSSSQQDQEGYEDGDNFDEASLAASTASSKHNALEGYTFVERKKAITWNPDVSYKKKLDQIRTQMTPAEIYRHRLDTIGRLARALLRLESLWTKDFDRWNNAASRVKAFWRGVKDRRYFETIKLSLTILREQREVKFRALQLYHSGQVIEAIQSLESARELTIELVSMQLQFHYEIEDYEGCIATAKKHMEKVPTRQQGGHRYMIATSLAKLKRYEECYTELCVINSLCEPLNAATRLRAYISSCFIEPPRLLEALDDFLLLLKDTPEDLELVLQRSCVYVRLQDWDKAILDFDYILYYQPNLEQVKCMRARAYCCTRRWAKAIAEYNDILLNNPECVDAINALAVLNAPYEPLPMLDPTVVES